MRLRSLYSGACSRRATGPRRIALVRGKTVSSREQGVMLIEALVGILIFSIGILALIAMQTAAISAQSDAQYRIEASNLANKMLSDIWVNVDRTNATTIQTSLGNFSHQAGGGNCAFAGGVSTEASATDWVSEATTKLPGATATMQQIVVDTAIFNKVTITLCWQAPTENATRRHTLISHIN